MPKKPEIQLLFDSSYGDCAKRFGTEMRRVRVFGLDADDWRYLTGECVQCEGTGKVPCDEPVDGVNPDHSHDCDHCGGSGEHEDHDAHDARYETWDQITCRGDVFVVDGTIDEDALMVARDAWEKAGNCESDEWRAVITKHGGVICTVYQSDGDTFLIPEGMEWSDDEGWYQWPLADRAEIEIECYPEDNPVRGNALASGDEDEDRACEDAILRDLEGGNVWAWCTVRVVARDGKHEGSSSWIGGCSYENEKGFRECGEFEALKSEALEDLAANIERARRERRTGRAS